MIITAELRDLSHPDELQRILATIALLERAKREQITVRYDPPPIPWRGMDYVAWRGDSPDYDYDEASGRFSTDKLLGYGVSTAAAIEDLLTQEIEEEIAIVEAFERKYVRS